jgi:L-ascorbate metabolism protein UlaG (beta-lactamase superfamily)
MLGFETIGNATAICYDDVPVLATDPWIAGDAYFGSWASPYAIPQAQLDAIRRTKYIWLSHGHPDHTNPVSLDILSGKTILLPDHVGGRMARDLTALGFSVQIMPDRKWLPLSPGIKAM